MRNTIRFTPLAASLIAAAFAASASVASAQAAGGQARAAQATVAGLFAPATTSLADTGTLASTSDARDASANVASIPGVLSAETLSSSTIAWSDQVDSEASAARVGITIGGAAIAAGFVRAAASATTAGFAGSTSIDSLSVNGLPIEVSGQPNQTILIPGGRVVLNEQTITSSGLTVSALHASVAGLADVVIATATAGIR